MGLDDKIRNAAQDAYIKALRSNELVFAEGPAVTGKTWLAVGHAVQLLEQGLAERLGLADKQVIGYLGGLVHYEGLDLLFEALVRLREQAKARLGDRFDLKGFHDAVLLGGDMPLEVLGTVIAEWTARQGG